MRALLLALVLACLLPGVLGAAGLFGWHQRQLRAEVDRSNILTARAMVQAVDNHLLRAQAVAQALAGSDTLRRGDLARFHAEARDVLRDVGLATNVVLRDRQGRQLLNTVVPYGQPLPAPPAPEQVQGVFETGRPVLSDLFTGPVLRRPVMSVDVPVVVDGQVRYALGLGLLPAQFNHVLAMQQLPGAWVAAVLDRRGVIVARSLAADATVGRLASPGLLALMDQRAEGAGSSDTLEGQPVYAFYSRSPATGWTVAIGVPRPLAEAVPVRTASLMALGVAGLFAVGALLAWRIGGRISQAFSALATGAEALGTGRPVRLRTPPMQEASDVAASLQRAAALLAERSAGERQALQALREADRRKDEFIAILAHELRNPLAPVRTAVEILRRDAGASDPRQERARAAIERQVAHMARLVDDLLDVSRLKRGRLALHRERCDLATVARQCAHDYVSAAEAAGLALVADLPPHPLWVEGDPVRLAQMVGNLLNNALRFTEPGGRIEVRAGADPARGEARLEVADNGVGIAPDLLPRLFDAFSQAGQDLARSKGGLGLGLALTRGLARLHGGRVEARSEGPGRGATFILSLPLARMRPVAAGQEPAPPPSPQAGGAGLPAAGPAAASGEPAGVQAGGGPGTAHPARHRLLVVEDNRDAAQTLAELLALAGHEVRVAFDAESGLALARQWRPDAVVSDIGLPGALDGYGLARSLRAEPGLAGLRLVALSGYADARARQRAREAGFDVHLAKPTDLQTLEEALKGPLSS